MLIINEDDKAELEDILRQSVERVDGKGYILQRKIFVMINSCLSGFHPHPLNVGWAHSPE